MADRVTRGTPAYAPIWHASDLPNLGAADEGGVFREPVAAAPRRIGASAYVPTPDGRPLWFYIGVIFFAVLIAVAIGNLGLIALRALGL